MASISARRAILPLIVISSGGPRKWLEGKSPGGSSQVPDDGGDAGFLGFDALGQLELDQGPGQIVFRAAGLEIDIAGQIIGKKPQPQLEGDETDGVVQIGIIVPGEKISGRDR